MCRIWTGIQSVAAAAAADNKQLINKSNSKNSKNTKQNNIHEKINYIENPLNPNAIHTSETDEQKQCFLIAIADDCFLFLTFVK